MAMSRGDGNPTDNRKSERFRWKGQLFHCSLPNQRRTMEKPRNNAIYAPLFSIIEKVSQNNRYSEITRFLVKNGEN